MTTSEIFQQQIKQLKNSIDLHESEMRAALEFILTEQASQDDIVEFLTLLRDKGESASEIKGALKLMREKCHRLPLKSSPLFDTCGTGGDGKNTFNISTAVAFVLAGGGINIAKHGNRAVSSKSGSADVLKALGVNIEADANKVAHCIDEIGIGFLFAPHYHPAMKIVGPARQKIGTRTIFNLLGPMLNPAQPDFQIMGVYDQKLLPIITQVLKDTGSKAVAVVHGSDGMDEITLTGKTYISLYKDNHVDLFEFDPQEVGYDYCSPKDLEGGNAEENAKRLRRLLKGHSEAIDHCVHLNAALGFMVAGKTSDFKEGLLMAQESISSGRAYQKLEALIEISHS